MSTNIITKKAQSPITDNQNSNKQIVINAKTIKAKEANNKRKPIVINLHNANKDTLNEMYRFLDKVISSNKLNTSRDIRLIASNSLKTIHDIYNDEINSDNQKYFKNAGGFVNICGNIYNISDDGNKTVKYSPVLMEAILTPKQKELAENDVKVTNILYTTGEATSLEHALETRKQEAEYKKYQKYGEVIDNLQDITLKEQLEKNNRAILDRDRDNKGLEMLVTKYLATAYN